MLVGFGRDPPQELLEPKELREIQVPKALKAHKEHKGM